MTPVRREGVSLAGRSDLMLRILGIARDSHRQRIWYGNQRTTGTAINVQQHVFRSRPLSPAIHESARGSFPPRRSWVAERLRHVDSRSDEVPDAGEIPQVSWEESEALTSQSSPLEGAAPVGVPRGHIAIRHGRVQEASPGHSDQRTYERRSPRRRTREEYAWLYS